MDDILLYREQRGGEERRGDEERNLRCNISNVIPIVT